MSLEEKSWEALWPTTQPEIIQLYSINSPNGIKVATALEELELAYESHLVNLFADDQHRPEYVSLSPNSKIPVIIDPDGPDGRPIKMMESGAILLYLAEKTGKLLPTDAIKRNECLQWLFFQVAHIGPMFGQFEHFHRRGDKNDNEPYAIERYRQETLRLFDILEDRLADRKNIMGDDFTIADIAIFPWVSSMRRVNEEDLPLSEFPRTLEWHATCLERPSARVGVTVCAVQ